MSDTVVGYAIIGVVILVVLGVVFAITSRTAAAGAARPAPPRGVHLPPPSLLPALFSFAAALLGAGLAFRADGQLANPWLAIPGALLFVATVVAWVRAANVEWREAEHGTRHDEAAH